MDNLSDAQLQELRFIEVLNLLTYSSGDSPSIAPFDIYLEPRS